MQGLGCTGDGIRESQQRPVRPTRDYQERRASDPSWKEQKEEAELIAGAQGSLSWQRLGASSCGIWYRQG